MAPRLARKEIALELSGTWVFIKSVKTTSTSGYVVDFLHRPPARPAPSQKSYLLKKNHHIIQVGGDTSTGTTGKQINPKSESSRKYGYKPAFLLCDPVDCIACQAPLSTEFFRQENWSGLLFLSLGDLSTPGIEPRSPALQADSLRSQPPGKPWWEKLCISIKAYSQVQRNNALWILLTIGINDFLVI